MAANKKKNNKKAPARSNGNRANSEDQLTELNIKTVSRIEAETHANRTVSEIIAAAIAGFCGSMTFVWVHVVWFGLWIVVNTMTGWIFDPFPFTFLTLVVSLEAIFLSTFILITQNRDTAIADRRAHLDLQINLLAEQENTKMLYFLERIADKVGVDTTDDPSREALTQETDPERIMRQIEMEHGPVGEKPGD
jgi:uncharacterized membrane protein